MMVFVYWLVLGGGVGLGGMLCVLLVVVYVVGCVLVFVVVLGGGIYLVNVVDWSGFVYSCVLFVVV